MKLKSGKILLGSTLLVSALFAQQALAQTAPAVSFTAGVVANSKHDLSSTSSATLKSATITEVCVFCHTPHGADTGKGPLWNRVSAVTTTPSAIYGSSNSTGSMDSTVLATITTGSAACLTCHDGATALDAIINTPGSAAGSYNTANAGTAAFKITSATSGTIIGSLMGAGTGTDLSDDHPIGVAYGGGGFGVAAGTTTKDADFVLALASGTLAGVQVAKNGAAYAVATTLQTAPVATDKFWLDTQSTPTVRNKADMPLFVRAGFGVVGGQSDLQPAVECGTCHDVHNPGNGSFLRIANTASALCYACHIK